MACCTGMLKVVPAFSPESFESIITAGLLACLIFQAFPLRHRGAVAGDWKIIFSAYSCGDSSGISFSVVDG